MAESKTRRIGVWIILVLLFIGLIGFGTTGLSGNVRTLGTVGEKEVTVQDYANALSDQMTAFTAATQQPLSFPQAQAMGLDRSVLNQLITQRALDNETTRLGISVGDELVAEQVVQIPAFRGLDGSRPVAQVQTSQMLVQLQRLHSQLRATSTHKLGKKQGSSDQRI